LTCSGSNGFPKCIQIDVKNSSLTTNNHVAEANIIVIVWDTSINPTKRPNFRYLGRGGDCIYGGK
jgi:hypothetical protein